jgi:hypothetical protein
MVGDFPAISYLGLLTSHEAINVEVRINIKPETQSVITELFRSAVLYDLLVVHRRTPNAPRDVVSDNGSSHRAPSPITHRMK